MSSVDRRKSSESPGINLFKIILLLFCGLLSPPVQSIATDLMLPKVYRQQVDVSGWLMSEKLDGVRGYWNGKQLLSKNGNLFYPPKEFTETLPPFPVEGELWSGHNRFEQTVSIVRKQQPHSGWLQIRFAIFDVPQTPGNFTDRIKKADNWFGAHPSPYAFVIKQTLIHNEMHMLHELQRVEELGGEGLIIRRPEALYSAGRTAEILKVKNYQDAEAKVVAHLPGKARNQGRLGSLLVVLDDGTQFKIGSGFSDSEREMPPPAGTVITFKFYGKYQSGIPKFPSFVRVRQDKGL